MQLLNTVMAALYLRGLPGQSTPKRRWPMVLSALRAHSVASPCEAAQCMMKAGLPDEAAQLGVSEAWEEAHHLARHQHVLTVAAEGYPARWKLILGAGAPPALWAMGGHPENGKFVAVVGSREPAPSVCDAVEACVAELAAQGYGIISGGARGVDRVAAEAAIAHRVPLLIVRPTMASFPGALSSPAASLALNPASMKPGTAAFMERNALIYAAAEFALVFSPRYRQGGTWHGGIEALRRRLTRILVFNEPACIGARAMIALGASPLDPHSERGTMVSQGLANADAQGGLPLPDPW